MPSQWDSPDGSARVWFEGAAADGIRAQALDAFLSIPKRGAEAGGLLLGEVETAQPLRVRITGFAPLPCEYRFGPSYILSEADRENMANAVAAHGSDVVGLYRSYTGREAALEDPDRELIAAFFSRRPQIFLLIRPLTADRCEAAFAYGDGRVLHDPGPPEPFPFPATGDAPAPQEQGGFEPGAAEPERNAVAASTEPAESEAPVESPPPSPVRAEELEPAAAPESNLEARPVRPPLPPPPRLRRYADDEPRSSGRPRFWIPLIACIALSIGAAFVYEWWALGGRMATPPPPAPRTESADRLAPAPAGQPAEPTPRETPAEPRPETPPATPPALESRTAPTPPAVARSARPSRRVHTPASPRTQEPAVEPVAVHTVQPGVSEGIRSRISGRVIVPVQVRISESGRVTSAVPQKGGGAVYDYLSTLAAGAARNWRFQPARSRSGSPVPATKTLYFVFTNHE